jgi:hypothetical protein
MGAAWNMEHPTASRDDIIDIARTLVRMGVNVFYRMVELDRPECKRVA